MPENENTQQQVEANNPETGATNTQSQVNESNENKPHEEGKTFSQKDLDNVAARTRGATERETKKKLLAALGLSLDDEEKLSKYKEAYENSLSDEQKKSQEIEDLQVANQNLKNDLVEKDYIIEALIAMSGKKEEDVEKIVKMAKGLKTDDNTVKDCIEEVLEMIKPKEAEQNIPKGQPLTQPSTMVTINAETNPFKAETRNLTKQGELLRTNPELAKRLAAEAGVKLNI